jgi:hypothetical protein
MTLAAKEEIRLDASHWQFWVQDSEPGSAADEATFWTDEAFNNRLAVGDGVMAVETGTYDTVKVCVEQHHSKPSVNLTDWDHVTERGLEVRTEFILIKGCLSQSGLFFRVQPRHYRVRACHANLRESEREVPKSWTGEFRDWYLVQFWPGKLSRAKVLKRRQAGRTQG